jgi:Secretion system C-terminal sorting domain
LIDWEASAENARINVLEVDAAGCRAYGSLVVTLDVPLGIEDYLREHVVLYPNPSASDAIISSSYSNVLIIRVIDAHGREYRRYNLSPGDEQNLETKNLSPGLYLVEISDGRQSVTKKLIRN